MDELAPEPAFDLLAGSFAALRDQQELAVARAHGRVLARALVAPADLPSADLAAMDGYALRSSDATAARNELALAGRVLAGQHLAAAPAPGQCVRIMTGAPMPAACDAVVMMEHAQVGRDGRIVLPGPVAPGLNCRRRGEHLRAGTEALAAGRALRSADLALASAVGADNLRVFRALRVGVLSTGDELRAAPDLLPVGGAYDSNRPMLLAALGTGALEGIDLGICPDDSQALARAIDRAYELRVDALLTSGGAAMGDADVLRSQPGVCFQAVRMRPGRGLAYASWRRGAQSLAMLGLPGNAVAAYVMMHLLVRPLLLRMAGAQARPPLPLRLPITSDLQARAGRVDYRRARLVRGGAGATAVEVLPLQGSAMIRTVSAAEALVAVGPDPSYRAGDCLPCYLFEGIEPR